MHPVKETQGDVLYIDDEKVLRDVVSFQLKAAGFKVSTAGNGKEGLQRLTAAIPDLILLDGMMPVMSGYSFLEEIKNIKEYQEIPVIFISANNQEVSRDLAFTAGVVDYLKKPIAMKELIYKVKNHIHLAKARKHSHSELLDKVERLQDQSQILAEIMRHVLRLRHLTDIHLIADQAAIGFFQLCQAQVAYWRPWTTGPALIGGAHNALPADFNARQALVKRVFEAKHSPVELEGKLFFAAQGYVLEVLESPQNQPYLQDTLSLFFEAVVDVLTAFKDATVFHKVSQELREILKIRNQLVDDLQNIRKDSNSNVAGLALGLEKILDMSSVENASPEVLAEIQQLAGDMLIQTQYGDLANQKIFSIINSLSRIFSSLEAEVEPKASIDLGVAVSAVSADSISQNEPEGRQTNVDELLAGLGL